MPIKAHISFDKEAAKKLKRWATVDDIILGWQAEIDAEDHLIDAGLMDMTIEHFVKRAWLNTARKNKQDKP